MNRNRSTKRILLVNLKRKDEILTLVNIYALNNVSERKSFFSKIQKWIEEFALNEQKLIMGGGGGTLISQKKIG